MGHAGKLHDPKAADVDSTRFDQPFSQGATAVPSFLSEKDWKSLLYEIHSGQVIPVVGPKLVTVDDLG